MLFLSASDIRKAVTLDEVMHAIERSFKLYHSGEFYMPPRMHLDQGDNTLLLMPCFAGGAFSTKLVTVFPGAPEKGQPVINGVVVLNDGETGAPLAVLDGRAITALRTGAVGGVSVRHMAPVGASTVGVVGAGVQGYHQALFAVAARNLSDVYAYDVVPDAAEDFVERLQGERPGLRMHVASSVEELLAASDIVVTTTTSNDPVLPDEPGLLRGRHFVGIGSFKPNMREYPRSLYGLLAEVVVDTGHAIEETGDLVTPLAEGWIQPGQVVDMGEYLSRGRDPYERPNTTFFKCVGMALFDLVASDLVYGKAIELGVGQKLEL